MEVNEIEEMGNLTSLTNHQAAGRDDRVVQLWKVIACVWRYANNNENRQGYHHDTEH